MRLVFLVAWVALAVMLLLPLLRRPSARQPVAHQRDDLVKDPVCRTYVVRSRAVKRYQDGAPRYFCSPECARRYAARSPR